MPLSPTALSELGRSLATGITGQCDSKTHFKRNSELLSHAEVSLAIRIIMIVLS